MTKGAEAPFVIYRDVSKSGLLRPGNTPALRGNLSIVGEHFAAAQIGRGLAGNKLHATGTRLITLGRILVLHRCTDAVVLGGKGSDRDDGKCCATDLEHFATGLICAVIVHVEPPNW